MYETLPIIERVLNKVVLNTDRMSQKVNTLKGCPQSIYLFWRQLGFLLQGHPISARITLKDVKRCVNDASFVRRYD